MKIGSRRQREESIGSGSENLYGPGAGIHLAIDGKTATPLGVRREGARLSVDFAEGITAVGVTDRFDSQTALWKWRLENHGAHPSGVITQFLVLRLQLSCRGSLSPCLHGSRGGLDQPFYPPESWRQWNAMLPTEGLAWLPLQGGSQGGRSSNDQLPFFVIDEARPSGASWILGLGWSGDWNFNFYRRAEAVSFDLGMTHLRMRLQPGESLLQPELLIGRLEDRQGEAARQSLRRIISSRLQPTIDGNPVKPFTFWDHYYGDRGRITEASFLENVGDAAAIGCDYVVLDGGWTGGGLDGEFNSLLPHIGSWRPDPRRFPEGFARVRAMVKEKKRKLGLWFDIEEAHLQSEAIQRHPELFFTNPLPTGRDCRLLRLDTIAGRDWAFETISKNIRLANAKWLRLDFNTEPQTTWAAADSPERRGITECRYVENYWGLLDRLLAAFPDVLLENTASGGRRIDLGNLRRTHCDWFSDHSQSEAIMRYHLHGAARWLPSTRLNTTMAHTYLEPNRPVNWKAPLPASVYLSHFAGNFGVSDYPATYGKRGMAELSKYIQLYKEVADCFAGVFIPLGSQENIFAGPSGFAGLNAQNGKMAAILFGPDTTGYAESGCSGIDRLLKEKPIINDEGSEQFVAVRMWRN